MCQRAIPGALLTRVVEVKGHVLKSGRRFGDVRALWSLKIKYIENKREMGLQG